MLTDHLAAARSGDPGAVNAFLAECVPLVRRTAVRILGASNDMLDDAVQESLIKIWRNLHMYQDGYLDAWLKRVTTNICIDMLRHYRLQPSMVDHDDMDMLTGDPDPAEIALHAEQMERVRKAVALLSTKHRQAVEMVCLREMEYTEVAVVMAVPVGTVKSNVYRGREMLRKRLIGEN